VKLITGTTKSGGFAIWRSPHAPEGQWVLSVEPRAGVLHVLKYYPDRADAHRMLKRLERRKPARDPPKP
jgi:hypothetical protein